MRAVPGFRCRLEDHAFAYLRAPAGGSRASGGIDKRCRAPRPSRGQLPVACEQRQHAKQRSLAKPRLLAATDELEGLNDELYLTDAAGAELDVARHVLARDFTLDQALHLPQRVEHSVVEVAPIHEWRKDRIE